VPTPRIVITYCTQGRWQLRAQDVTHAEAARQADLAGDSITGGTEANG
jgi:predicted Rdx family selenoprotein